jgi:DNA invertase Pin-like site-specific DNA recombinase
VRIAEYRRVSTDEQRDSGAGLEAQRIAIEAEAARRGWTIVVRYEDTASGREMRRRAGLAGAMEAIESGQADALVVSKLDRLTRSVVDLGNIVRRARDRGWTLVILDPAIDLSSETGRLLANIVVSVSEWEREIIGSRTRDALRVKKAQGVRLGRRPSVPDDVRERIIAARAAGRTLRAIADELNAEQVPTGQGARRWHPETVRGIALAAQQREHDHRTPRDAKRRDHVATTPPRSASG